ncbi:MAG TPA: BamA/TamA family outer membrane protein [bacterium]|nr:BamA/TamA family outer membrane protein [bacterium]
MDESAPGHVSTGNTFKSSSQPFYLGYGSLIRGYEASSFLPEECPPGGFSCVAFDRLIGDKLVIANLEFRIPLFGTDAFGLLNFPFLPTEISPFFDAGIAWNKGDPPVLTWAEQSFERIPVFSTGVATRMNIMGYLILQVYYAFPFQRPEKGFHWGFTIEPGW